VLLTLRRSAQFLLALGLALGARSARAEIVIAEPAQPVVVGFPAGAPPVEVQVVVSLVVDEAGRVESAVVARHVPADAAPDFDAAALAALRRAAFKPSQRDGHAIRSRVEYVVVFQPPDTRAEQPPVPAPAVAAPAGPRVESARGAIDEQDEDYALTIEVRGQSWSAPRGIGDLRLKRELLDAAPHALASEMLSAAPGFFVDHEDGEGLGNDMFLRGFTLEHGSGIEMRVGNVPINHPVHVQGQGYADADFIIPEVVRSIRVLEGPYDPRQGDSALVGSAYFDLGVSERANELKASYGSFQQTRVVGIAAPAGFDEQTFAAFSLRKSDGFGSHRASEAGTMNAQYGLDLGKDSHLRLLATAYGARRELAGVLRQSDLDSGQIGFYDRYPFFAEQQGAQSSRVIVGADFDTVTEGGSHFELAPWLMWSNFLARQNFTGTLLSSALAPQLAGAADLWETTNRESAAGAVSRLHAAPLRVADFLELSAEPGTSVRVGHTEQSASLLQPATLLAWDRRLDAGLDTLDAGAYLDVGLRFWARARLSGGVRADLMSVSVNDRLGYDVPAGQAPAATLPGANRAAQGLVVSPRLTAEYDFVPELTAVLAYGEGFRSLGAAASAESTAATAGSMPSIQDGVRPYSKVRAYEAGFRAHTRGERFSATCSVFETRVASELVFEASSGVFTAEGASVRRGLVASLVSRPFQWLLASVAATISSATFTSSAPGEPHFVPGVPPLLVRGDLSAHGRLARVRQKALAGRIGAGYTFLSGRHLSDERVGPSDHVLNGHAALRYDHWELGVEGFNLLGRHYADDRQDYVSNWSVQPGTAAASGATHVSAAPPLTVLGTLALFF